MPDVGELMMMAARAISMGPRPRQQIDGYIAAAAWLRASGLAIAEEAALMADRNADEIRPQVQAQEAADAVKAEQDRLAREAEITAEFEAGRNPPEDDG